MKWRQMYLGPEKNEWIPFPNTEEEISTQYETCFKFGPASSFNFYTKPKFRWKEIC